MDRQVRVAATLLPAVAAHLGDSHPVDADILQGLFCVFQFVRLDDGFYFFHWMVSGGGYESRL